MMDQKSIKFKTVPKYMQSVPLGSKKHKNWETYANHFFLESHQVGPKTGINWRPMISQFSVIRESPSSIQNSMPQSSETTQFSESMPQPDARMRIDYVTHP